MKPNVVAVIIYLTHAWPEILVHAMSDWLYANAGGLTPLDDGLWLELVNVETGKPTRAFCSKITQIRRFWELPPFIMEVVALNIHALTDTAIKLTGNPRLTSEEARRLNDEIVAETKARVQQKFDATGSFEAATGYDFQRSVTAFSAFINHCPQLSDAVRLILFSQLSMTWTAFESLCADLARAADFRRVLSEHQSFQSLKLITKAYHDVFGDDERIEAVVRDKAVRQLNIVRNLYAHTGGIVDEKSVNHAREIAWHVDWVVDQPFPINGEVVRLLANPVIKLGAELSHAVDAWLTRHK